MKVLTTFPLAFVALCLAHSGNAQDKWEGADSAAIRLRPAAFLQLPENVVQYLPGARLHDSSDVPERRPT